jgi:Tfp pilus assembly protein PilP
MIGTVHATRRTERSGRRLAQWFCLLALCGLAGLGCREETTVHKSVKKKIEPVRNRSVPDPAATTGSEMNEAASELLPPAVPEEEGSLSEAASSEKRRDPFRSFIEVKETETGARKAPARPLTPLQKYSLDQLKVVGVIDGATVRKALIEDDAGKGYVVGVGDAVGNQGGRIVAIRPDRIVIQETLTDPLGEEKVRHVTKKLYAVKEEGYP